MTPPFVFDARAALEAIKSSDLPQLSRAGRLIRQPIPTESRSDLDCATYSHNGENCANATPLRSPAPQNSHLSQLSRALAQLSAEARGHFEERAAIMEYDGCLPRPLAERHALEDTLRQHAESSN